MTANKCDLCDQDMQPNDGGICNRCQWQLEDERDAEWWESA